MFDEISGALLSSAIRIVASVTPAEDDRNPTEFDIGSYWAQATAGRGCEL